MNEQQLQSVAERLATKRGLSAKSAGRIVDVPFDTKSVIDYFDSFYEYLVAVYDQQVGISEVITADEFRTVMMAVLAKRIQWVRHRTNGVREGATIQVSNTTVLPGPIYSLVYQFGQVESREGAIFLPSMMDLLDWGQRLNVAIMRKYLQFVGKMKHYYTFSEGLPSQDRGSFGYLVVAEITSIGALMTGPTSEATPHDVFLASVVRCARILAGHFYGSVYGIVQNPDVARVEYFDAYGKGVGDGQ
jgi:hypothetical protein